MVLCLSLMVIMVANGSLNVALPQMAEDLHASSSQLQWMVDAYSLVFAGMLFTAGTIGDRFGRKLVLQAGMLLFLLGSVVASMANTSGQVIALRAVMGFAAAFVMPSTLSLLTNVFEPHERPKAISIWAGIAAGGAALGPPISGFLVEHFWWGSVFLINVPLLAVAIVAGRILLPESRDPEQHRIDVPGAVLSILAIGALVYAIIEAPEEGWGSAHTLISFTIAAVALLAFVVRERTAEDPMFDLQLLHNPRFSISSVGIALCFFAMFGVAFMATQYLQMVLGFTPFHAGLIMLPLPLILMLLAPQAPKFVHRFGIATMVPIGMGLIATGLLVFSTLGTTSHGWQIYFAIAPMMVGMAITMSPFTALIMTSVPPERAGMGSAMNDTTRELGGALGVAVLGSIVTTHYRSEMAPTVATLPAEAGEQVASGLAGALQAATSLPADVAGSVVEQARQAFTDGMGIAAVVGASVVIVVATIATMLLRRMGTEPAQRAILAMESPEADTVLP